MEVTFNLNLDLFVEWIPWALALISTWLYGKTRILGATVGMLAAISFVMAGEYFSNSGMIAGNIVFMTVHAYNFFRTD